MPQLLESIRRPLIFGIINVTPDSFSDGGEFASTTSSIPYSEILLEQGTDFLDIGAESTKPGSLSISPGEEWSRLKPLIEHLQKKDLLHKVSIDTRNFETMQKVSDLGVSWINCVGATPDDDNLNRLLKNNSNLGFVATHIHGIPQNMQLQPLNARKAVGRVSEFFESSHQQLKAIGFKSEKILLDPGIGFGKTDAANMFLLRQCHQWTSNYNIAVGVSRKSMFDRLLDIPSPKDRDHVSKITELALCLSNVSMIRTHDVFGLIKAMKPLQEVLS